VDIDVEEEEEEGEPDPSQLLDESPKPASEFLELNPLEEEAVEDEDDRLEDKTAAELAGTVAKNKTGSDRLTGTGSLDFSTKAAVG
jgi:hypothetical protein